MEEDRLGMTSEQWEVFTSLTRGFPNQDENWVDLSLLRENLKLSPLERLRRLERAVAELRAIRGDADTPLCSNVPPGSGLSSRPGNLPSTRRKGRAYGFNSPNKAT